MFILEAQLEKVRTKESELLKKIEEQNKKKTIGCNGCGDKHKIGELTAIQTYWHVEPRGCTEGDYWLQGELKFICPETNVENRLLFDNSNVPWDKRKEYDNNPELQFKSNYKKLFKKVVDEYEGKYEKSDRKWVNNKYIDKHRTEFGISIKG